MLSKEEIEEAKETMQHWIEYEKMNKTKINKADGLIKIQETLLQYIKELEISNKELNKENDRLEKIEFERDEANKEIKELKKRYNISYG